MTLLFGAKETRYNTAQALLAVLEEEDLTGGEGT